MTRRNRIHPTLSRRSLLGASAASVGILGLPFRPGYASPLAASAYKYIFVMNYGGWDPTRVFANEFSNPSVDMERLGDTVTWGDLTYVTHEDRPSVDEFMATFYERTMFVNGLLVPSIAHENCLKISMTGTTADGKSDWPAILAAERMEDFSLPHVVVGGPSYPGPLAGVSTRTGSSGQLEGLLSGEILEESDVSVALPESELQDIMERYMDARVAAASRSAQFAAEIELTESYANALSQANELKGLLHLADWAGGSTLSDQLRLAVDLLALGVSRCATVSFTPGWDTHTANDTDQSNHFEALFIELLDLQRSLEATPGETAESLADETVVVVMSEMGRTPQHNEDKGKDHWPYTCMMVCGPGIQGGRVIGGFDGLYYGQKVDPDTAEQSDDGIDITAGSMGATLLQLADIDPAQFLPGVAPIPGMLK